MTISHVDLTDTVNRTINETLKSDDERQVSRANARLIVTATDEVGTALSINNARAANEMTKDAVSVQDHTSKRKQEIIKKMEGLKTDSEEYKSYAADLTFLNSIVAATSKVVASVGKRLDPEPA